MWINIPSLQEAISDVDLYEFRQRQGKRYDLEAILLLSCVALLSGAQSEQEISVWASRQGKRWMKWLGMKAERCPSAATITRIFSGIDQVRLETAMVEWTEDILDYFQLSEPSSGKNAWDELAFDFQDADIIPMRYADTYDLLIALRDRLSSFLYKLTGVKAGALEGLIPVADLESLLVGLILSGYIEADVFHKIREGEVLLGKESFDGFRVEGLQINSTIHGQRWHLITV